MQEKLELWRAGADAGANANVGLSVAEKLIDAQQPCV